MQTKIDVVNTFVNDVLDKDVSRLVMGYWNMYKDTYAFYEYMEEFRALFTDPKEWFNYLIENPLMWLTDLEPHRKHVEIYCDPRDGWPMNLWSVHNRYTSLEETIFMFDEPVSPFARRHIEISHLTSWFIAWVRFSHVRSPQIMCELYVLGNRTKARCPFPDDRSERIWSCPTTCMCQCTG